MVAGAIRGTILLRRFAIHCESLRCFLLQEHLLHPAVPENCQCNTVRLDSMVYRILLRYSFPKTPNRGELGDRGGWHLNRFPDLLYRPNRD